MLQTWIQAHRWQVGGAAFFALWVWSRHVQLAMRIIIAAFFRYVVWGTIDRFLNLLAAGIRGAVNSAIRAKQDVQQHRTVQGQRVRVEVAKLMALRPYQDFNKPTRSAISNGMASLAELAGWKATPSKASISATGRHFVWSADDEPDLKRLSIIMCKAGLDTPLARMNLYRERYGDSSLVHIEIADKRKTKAPLVKPTRPSTAPPFDQFANGNTLIGQADDGEKRTANDSGEQFDDPYLAVVAASNGLTLSEIVAAVGRSKSTVHKALEKRVRDNLLYKAGYVYHMPSGS